MNVISTSSDSSERYARCIQRSKRVRWDIEQDVIRARSFDTAHKFLPDGLSMADAFTTLSADEKRSVSQIQGRTYANMFGLVERFINAKVLELSEGHWFGDQVALEALVRFSDEELKHQALFPLVDAMAGDVLPAGYRFDVDHNAVGHAVLGKSTWAVLALTLDIELFTQLHYRQSIDADPELSELFKDVFLFHWREENQHAILDELEWVRHDPGLEGGGARFRGRRTHRVGRGAGRHPAGPDQSRWRLLHDNVRPSGRQRGGARNRDRIPQSLPLPTSTQASSIRNSARCCPA
ncbi:hypothetical protein QA641_31550 [Bradyrhizobium sp. CB1650]|uniref:hypothetical protein n=1 Tax=Bradyrhizobium sp. CB1650 TaxID=3039153 RepID=UPI002434D6CB|nr:hypothetical protein [Bradyrhizobium sp. CB1650]WGD50126.1 hypothetical protein QA641_31550 [Bradyrhizobium sp. CB1650]